MCCDKNNRHRWVDLTDCPAHLEPVDVGHFDIQENQVEVPDVLRSLQSFTAICRFDYLEVSDPRKLEKFLDRQANSGVVVNNQNDFFLHQLIPPEIGLIENIHTVSLFRYNRTVPSPNFLSFGDIGPEVSDLAQLLIQRGFLIGPDVGFEFNRTLRQAVKDFQARHLDPRGRPLAVDGIVGPLTHWALTHPNNAAPYQPLHKAPDPPPGPATWGRAALEIALLEIKSGAGEVGANNSGPSVEKYLSGRASTPTNWCAAFVCWCFAQHPEPAPFRFTLGARGLRNTFRRRGWLIEPSAEHPLLPGDLVFWWRDQPSSWKGHIGLVHHVADGILYTVEGNKGGFPAPVRVFDYVLARMERLLGFGRVPD